MPGAIANLSSSTPHAPVTGRNVHWQNDGSNLPNLSAYVDTSVQAFPDPTAGLNIYEEFLGKGGSPGAAGEVGELGWLVATSTGTVIPYNLAGSIGAVQIQGGSWTYIQLPLCGSGPIALTVTSCNGSIGGSAVYNGTFPGGAGNGYAGRTITISGFLSGTTNGIFLCTASTATTITLNNSNGINTSSGAPAGATYAGILPLSTLTFDSLWRVYSNDVNARANFGFYDAYNAATGNPARDGVYINYIGGTWQPFTTTGGSTTDGAATAIGGSVFHTFRIRATMAGTILFSVDGGAEQSISTTVPSQPLNMLCSFFPGAGGTRQVYYDYVWAHVDVNR